MDSCEHFLNIIFSGKPSFFVFYLVFFVDSTSCKSFRNIERLKNRFDICGGILSCFYLEILIESLVFLGIFFS